MFLREAMKRPELEYGFRHVKDSSPLFRFSVAHNYDTPEHYKHLQHTIVNVNYLFKDIRDRGWLTSRPEHFKLLFEPAYGRSDKCAQKLLHCIWNLLQSLRITDEIIGGPQKYSLGRSLIAEIEISTATLYRDVLAELQTMANYNAGEIYGEDKLWAKSFLPHVIHNWRLYVTPLLLAIEDFIGTSGKILGENAFDGLGFEETKQVIAALRTLPPQKRGRV